MQSGGKEDVLQQSPVLKAAGGHGTDSQKWVELDS
jgi:hypothetical protein